MRRSHSIEFKRQVAQACIAGEKLHGLAKRHDVARNLIRIWVRKYEAGTFEDDAQALPAFVARLSDTGDLRAIITALIDGFAFFAGCSTRAPRRTTEV